MPDILTQHGLVSIEQAAQRKGVTISAIYALIRRGRLPATQIGNQRFVKVHDLDALTPLKPGRKTK